MDFFLENGINSGLCNCAQPSSYNELSFKAAHQNINESSPILKEIKCKVHIIISPTVLGEEF
jgi:hypothetical protein